jgi:hypothetical protein
VDFVRQLFVIVELETLARVLQVLKSWEAAID